VVEKKKGPEPENGTGVQHGASKDREGGEKKRVFWRKNPKNRENDQSTNLTRRTEYKRGVLTRVKRGGGDLELGEGGCRRVDGRGDPRKLLATCSSRLVWKGWRGGRMTEE